MTDPTIVAIGSFVGLGLMFEAGRRWGHARHHAVCHGPQEVAIPIDWEAAWAVLDRYLYGNVDVPSVEEVTGEIIDAAFPGMLNTAQQHSMDVGQRMGEQVYGPDFDFKQMTDKMKVFIEDNNINMEPSSEAELQETIRQLSTFIDKQAP